jgi:hypothetical protein
MSKEFDYCEFGEFEGEVHSLIANASKYTKKEAINFFKEFVCNGIIDLYNRNDGELTQEEIETVLELISESNVEETYIYNSIEDETFDWLECNKDHIGAIACWKIDKEKIAFIDDIETEE